jgi:Flp pilus assembly protein TadG
MTLPLLALLLFGIIQYGFIFGAYITLRNASAVAARHAILQSPTPSQTEVQNVAREAIMPMLTPNNLASVSVTSVNVAGQPATNVTVVYNMPLIVPFVVPGKSAGGSLTLSATTIMR